MNLRELCELLKNAETIDDIDSRQEDILNLIPTAGRMVGYDQQNHAHPFDLWYHSLHTVLGLPRGLDDDMLYLAALLHDIGKPDCRIPGELDGKPNMHYYGHPQRSRELAEFEIIPTLEWDGNFLSDGEKARLLYYVGCHDDQVSLREKHLKKHLKVATFAEFQKLMLLQIADAKAHIQLPVIAERAEICSAWAGEYGLETYQKILSTIQNKNHVYCRGEDYER